MSKQKDDILYCENCGISFLWSIEEQHQARGETIEGAGARQPMRQPLLCPGCRYLLPDSDRERGFVRWYNARKRYGFIMRREQPDLFAHLSEVEGGKRLRKGAFVEFNVGESARGPVAQLIQILEVDH